jgi:hypothetical protein
MQREAKQLEAAAERAREIGANYLASRLDAEAKRLRLVAVLLAAAPLDPPPSSA